MKKNDEEYRNSPRKKQYRYIEDRDNLLRILNILADMQRTQNVLSAIIGVLLLGIFLIGLTYFLMNG